MSVPILVGAYLDGTDINIMINALIGPAILWQVVYSVLSFVILLIGIVLGLGIVTEFPSPHDRAFNVYLRLSMFAGLAILIGTIVYDAQNVPVLGSAAHWLIHHWGPM